MQLVVLVADLAGSEPLLYGLGLGGGAILVKHIIPPESGKPGVHISRKNTAHYVAKVRHIVHVGEGGCDEDNPLSIVRNCMILGKAVILSRAGDRPYMGSA